MAERILIQCPGCSTKLGLSDSSKLGKKIRCSKCKEVFVAQALKAATTKSAGAKPTKPAAKSAPAKKPAKKSDDDEFNFDDTEMEDQPDAEGDDEQQDEAPPVRSIAGGKKVASKGKGKGKKKSGGLPLPLIIGGSVAAVLLLGVLGYFLFSGKKEEPVAVQPAATVAAAQPIQDFPNDRLLALKWMPAETELILHLKVAEVWNAPLLKGLLSGPLVQEQVQKMQLATGLAPTDIDSVTIGVKDLQKAQQAGPMMALGGPPPTDSLSLVVIRSKKPVDPAKLLSQLAALDPTKSKIADHGGKQYLEAVTSPSAPAFGAWLADSSTLISGTTTELFAAMDRGETNTPRAGFRGIDATSHLVFAMCPINPQSLSQSSPPLPPGTSPAIAEMQKAIQESMTAFGLGIGVTGGVDLRTSIVSKDSAGSANIKVGLEAAVSEGKSMLTAKQSTTPPLLFELGEMLLNNVKVSDQNQVALVSTNIPDSAQQKLEQLPTVAMGMMLTGGLAGGGINPPAAANNAVDEAQAKNNLKQILLALHNSHDINSTFPATCNRDSEGKPLLSWRVHILPFIEQNDLYKQFHLNEPWDSEHNRQLVPQMPATYASPDDEELKNQGLTRYVVPVGTGMAFDGQAGIKLTDFQDGTSNTIMALEVAAAAAVEWTKPDDLTIDLSEPFRNLGGSRGDHFLVAFADGTVRVIKDSIVAETLKAIFTRKGGEKVLPDSF